MIITPLTVFIGGLVILHHLSTESERVESTQQVYAQDSFKYIQTVWTILAHGSSSEADPRTVHIDVDRTEGIHAFLDGSLDSFFTGDVAGSKDGVGT